MQVSENTTALLKGGFGVLCVQLTNRIVMLVLSIVLARSLGATGYGIYAYAFAIIGLAAVVAEFGFPTLLERLVASNEAQQSWQTLKGVLQRATHAVFLISVTLSLVLAGYANWYFDGWETNQGQVLLIATLLIPAGALVRTWCGALTGFRQVVKGKILEMLLRPIIVLAAVSLAFWYQPSLREPQTAIWAQLAAVVLACVLARLLLNTYTPAAVTQSTAVYATRQWFTSAFPLTIATAASAVTGLSDIVILGIFHPPSDVGVYRVAAQSALLVTMALQAANMILAPRFARLWSENKIASMQVLVTQSTRVVLGIALLVFTAIWLFGQPLLTLVFGADYDKAYLPLAILAAGQVINAGFGSVGYLLTMTGNEAASAKGMAIAAIINVALNFVLIPRWGMMGAAVATTLSLVFWNVLLHRNVRVLTRIRSTAFGV